MWVRRCYRGGALRRGHSCLIRNSSGGTVDLSDKEQRWWNSSNKEPARIEHHLCSYDGSIPPPPWGEYYSLSKSWPKLKKHLYPKCEHIIRQYCIKSLFRLDPVGDSQCRPDSGFVHSSRPVWQMLKTGLKLSAKKSAIQSDICLPGGIHFWNVFPKCTKLLLHCNCNDSASSRM